MLALLPFAFSMASCDVHEFPEIPTETNFTLYLDFDKEMPLHKEIVHTVRSVNDVEMYDVRHILSIHRLSSDGEYDRTADTLIVFTCDDVVNLNCSRELILHEGDYKFFVWTDFVKEGSLNDKFYKTSDFVEIILSDKDLHMGSCDYRDAFRGEQQAMVRVRKNEMMEVDNTATIVMKRPLAKFKFISTDYDQFLEKALEAEATRLTKEGMGGTKGETDETRAINPDDYKVIFRYTGFMPCSYNMFTDKPADAWMGVSFESRMKPLEDAEVELGFDYMFVNGNETSVYVMLEVYHKDGELIASSPSINVPLKRSRLTIVRGRFLTSIVEGGVGIAPDFDGEYNIEIK